MSAIKDLTGQRFGRLLVVSKSETKRNAHAHWNCVCDCGEKIVVASDKLLLKSALSCGCLRREKLLEARTTHGGSNSRLYNIWVLMRRRCADTHNADYGGRGISVCGEWNDFEAFREWAEKTGYNDELTIERRDVNGNYEPNNCCWITNREQQYNKRNSVRVTFNGKTLPLKEWARELHIPYTTLWHRLNTLNWTPNRALSTPAKGDAVCE